MMKRLSGSWVRSAEHSILRVVSLVFSMASAYAIRLFFAPLDVADAGEKVITWAVAIGFGILGYVVSRGLVHRMMHKESIWAYAPICFLVELVDIACNYVLAASVVQQAWWLNAVPQAQRGLLTLITYVVLSAIPLVSLFLAVVDMDLERSKYASMGGNIGSPFGKPVMGSRLVPPQSGTQRASLLGKSGPVLANGGNNANNANSANDAAARRAAFFSNRQQGQQGSGGNQAGARDLLADPDKDLSLAGVP
jgi:hypothetical protein